jgi:hypothetical protein
MFQLKYKKSSSGDDRVPKFSLMIAQNLSNYKRRVGSVYITFGPTATRSNGVLFFCVWSPERDSFIVQNACIPKQHSVTVALLWLEGKVTLYVL